MFLLDYEFWRLRFVGRNVGDDFGVFPFLLGFLEDVFCVWLGICQY